MQDAGEDTSAGAPATDRHAGYATGDIRDVCIGLFGIQVVWGLQTANTSRIFQTLGADIATLPVLWIAGPITGLLVQPLIGGWSDRRSTRAGLIAIGVVLTALAMLGMVNATTLSGAVLMLWLLAASLNVVMPPFRTIAADRLAPVQRARGFAIQAAFIGAGAVFASALPWTLTEWLGVSARATDGTADNVQLAFGLGAGLLVVSVGWALVRAFREGTTEPGPDMAARATAPRPPPRRWLGPVLMLASALLAFAAWEWALARDLVLLGAAGLVIGFTLLAGRYARGGRAAALFAPFMELASVPRRLQALALVQFLTWFGLFATWVYLVPAVAWRQFGTSDPASAGYAQAANWVGLLFAIQDAVAIVVALALPRLVVRTGQARAHALCLLVGAVGMAWFAISAAAWLWLSAIGLGVAWASILSAPYALVAASAPAGKVGTFMGLHNMTLVVPQLVGASTLGWVLTSLFAGDPAGMPVVAGVAFALAALASVTILRK